MPDNERLELVDQLAQLMIARNAPVCYGTAETAQQRTAAYRLRSQALIDRGFASPSDFQDGLEHDSFDERGIHILGWDETGEVIAAGRIVLPEAGLLLPTEAAFGLIVEPRGQVFDVGRFVVAHHFSNRANLCFVGLLAFAWLVARRHGYHLACGTASASMLRYYRRIGFTFNALAPPRRYFGEERTPYRPDVVGSLETLMKAWGQE
ncbi:MAG: GNAT family N-acyltransferase [Anaerolineae bacterium]